MTPPQALRGRSPPARERWSRDLTRGGVERILVIKWSAMGDVVIATAAMQDLREGFPDSVLHLNTMAPWDRLFRGDPRFDEVFCVDLGGREAGLRGHWRWLRRVRRARYDLVVDLQCNDHTRLLLTALAWSGAGIAHRLGYYRRYPYNIAPAERAGRHHTHDYMRAALRAAGLTPRTERPVLHLPAERCRRARELMRRHALEARRYAVFLPGSQAAGYLKRWGAQRYAELARRVHAAGLEHVVLLGGPDELDECRRIEHACGPWLVNLCGQTDVLDLVPICEGARFVVGNDTGTAHVAAAAARPMVVVCGPTDPRRVKPLGTNVVAMQAPLPCVNCYRKHCGHHSCMRTVGVEDVLGRIQASAGFP